MTDEEKCPEKEDTTEKEKTEGEPKKHPKDGGKEKRELAVARKELEELQKKLAAEKSFDVAAGVRRSSDDIRTSDCPPGKSPMRSLGPCRSASRATGRPTDFSASRAAAKRAAGSSPYANGASA